MSPWKKNNNNRYHNNRPAPMSMINVNDVIDFIYDFFSDFRTKLKRNRFDRINMDVPRLIISKFKELFEIWDTNLMVSKSLDKDLFEEVYTSMADVFENYSTDSSDLTWVSCDATSYLECELCGEEIVLRNNNREYSVAYHNSSRQHLEFVENLGKVRKEQCEPEPESEPPKIVDDPQPDQHLEFVENLGEVREEQCEPEPESEPPKIDDSQPDQHLEFVENLGEVREEHSEPEFEPELEPESEPPKIDDPQPEEQEEEDDCLKCDECDEQIVPIDDNVEDALELHKKSLLHWELVNEKKLENFQFITKVFDDQGVTVKCHLCNASISIETSNPNYPIDVISSHTKGENHILNMYWLQLQSSYVKMHDVEENLIKCTLCDEIFALDSFHDHFYAGSNSQHGRRMLLASIKVDKLWKFADEIKLQCITRLKTDNGVFMKCHLCRVLILANVADSNEPEKDDETDKYLTDAVRMHLETEDHLLNLYWLELQYCYVMVRDRRENLLECTLCNEIFRLESFHDHFYAGSNSQHARRMLLSSIDPANLRKAASEMKIDCINQVENAAGTFMRCHICHVLIPTVSNMGKYTNNYIIDVVNLHQQDEDHILNLYRLQLQNRYIEVYDRKQNIIKCTLCEGVFHLDSFQEHFYGTGSTNEHARRSLLVAISEKRAKLVQAVLQD